MKRLTRTETSRRAGRSAPVLVQRAVAGVRVEDQLRIRNVLLQDVRVDGVDDHVVVAVEHQRRLRDGVQVLVRLLARCAPLGQRAELRRRDLLVHLRVAVLAAQAEALQERGTGGLAGLGGVEVHVLPQQVRLGPLEGEAPTIDVAVGYSKSNTSPILKLFLSRLDELVGANLQH